MTDPMVELATSTAAALIESIVKKTDWSAAKRAITKLWSRHDADDAEFIDSSLKRTEAKLESADEQNLADVQASFTDTWTNHFKDLLRTRPEAAEELKELLAALVPEGTEAGGARQGDVIQLTATASHGSTVNQVGKVTGRSGLGSMNFNFGSAVPAPPAPPQPES